MPNDGIWDHCHELLGQENLQYLCQGPGRQNRSENYCLLCVDWLLHASFSRTSFFDGGPRASPPPPRLQKLRLAGQKQPCPLDQEGSAVNSTHFVFKAVRTSLERKSRVFSQHLKAAAW